VGPAAQQIPGSQPHQFGDQQPHAQQVAGDLVREQLANAAFQAAGITRLGLDSLLADLRQDRGFRVGSVAIEFFFVVRALSRCDRRFGN
jgi:hypothetical protein